MIKLSNPYKYDAAAPVIDARNGGDGHEKGSMADPARPDRPPLLLCGANRAVLLLRVLLSNGINQIYIHNQSSPKRADLICQARVRLTRDDDEADGQE